MLSAANDAAPSRTIGLDRLTASTRERNRCRPRDDHGILAQRSAIALRTHLNGMITSSTIRADSIGTRKETR